MPTSPTPAIRSVPTSAATTNDAGTDTRAQSTEGQSQRPGTKRARVDDDDAEDLTGVVVKIGAGAQQSTLARLRDTQTPQSGEGGNKVVPEAFQPTPNEAMEDAPIAVQQGGAAVGGSGGGVLVTQGRGGRGLGRTPTGQREPFRGREDSRAPFRTRRGPKKTAHQRRFSANRPSGYHPQLRPWDLTPLDVRSTTSGQERAIFRTRGLLVCHFDFQLYRMLYTFNVGQIDSVFPTAPQWWPSDWGQIPITLPWEVSLYRSLLVSADANDPLWKEVYQKFLEQLAGGWDLYHNQTQDVSTLVALPIGLARAMVDAGAFAFCAGRLQSPSFVKFCELHSFDVEGLPDQRGAKNSAWQKINTLLKERKEAVGTGGTAAARLACQCHERVMRAANRLGLEAQTLEAVSEGAPLDVTGTPERVTSLASAAMTYCIQASQILERAEEKLSFTRRDLYNRDLDDAHGALRSAATLSDFLPRRFAANLSRVGPGV